MYVCMYGSLSLSIYIYIYVYIDTSITNILIHIYIYIYTHIIHTLRGLLLGACERPSERRDVLVVPRVA